MASDHLGFRHFLRRLFKRQGLVKPYSLGNSVNSTASGGAMLLYGHGAFLSARVRVDLVNFRHVITSLVCQVFALQIGVIVLFPSTQTHMARLL